MGMDLYHQYEIGSIPLSSQTSQTDWSHAIIEIDASQYDGVVTTTFEINALNTDSVDRVVTLRDVTNSVDASTITVPTGTTVHKRIRASAPFTLATGGFVRYRMRTEATNSGGQLVVTGMRIIIQQVNATKTKVQFPLGNDGAPDTSGGGGFIERHNNTSYQEFDNSSGTKHTRTDFQRDDTKFVNCTIESLECHINGRHSSALGAEGRIKVWNNTDGVEVAGTEVSFGVAVNPGILHAYERATWLPTASGWTGDDGDEYTVTGRYISGTGGFVEWRTGMLYFVVTGLGPGSEVPTWIRLGKSLLNRQSTLAQTPVMWLHEDAPYGSSSVTGESFAYGWLDSGTWTASLSRWDSDDNSGTETIAGGGAQFTVATTGTDGPDFVQAGSPAFTFSDGDRFAANWNEDTAGQLDLTALFAELTIIAPPGGGTPPPAGPPTVGSIIWEIEQVLPDAPDEQTLLLWLRLALDKLALEEFDFFDLWVDPLVVTRQGQHSYQLPMDFGQNFVNLKNKFAVMSSDGTHERNLTYLPQKEFYRRNLEGADESEPIEYTIELTEAYQKVIRLFPTPDGVYTIRGLYTPMWRELLQTHELPPIPNARPWMFYSLLSQVDPTNPAWAEQFARAERNIYLQAARSRRVRTTIHQDWLGGTHGRP